MKAFKQTFKYINKLFLKCAVLFEIRSHRFSFNMQIIVLNMFVVYISCLDLNTFHFYKDSTSICDRFAHSSSPVGLMACSFLLKMSQVINFLPGDFISQIWFLEVLTFGLHFLFHILISKEQLPWTKSLPKEIKQCIRLGKMANLQG